MDTETDKKGKQQSTGFANAVPVCPVQLKRIENSLHQSWKIYKSNLDPVVTHKFTSVLVTSLESLGSIFSWTRYDCAGLTTVVEDILAMAPVIFQLTPVPALRCMKHVSQSLRLLKYLLRQQFVFLSHSFCVGLIHPLRQL